jgi:hypothetical protein
VDGVQLFMSPWYAKLPSYDNAVDVSLPLAQLVLHTVITNVQRMYAAKFVCSQTFCSKVVDLHVLCVTAKYLIDLWFNQNRLLSTR